MKFLVAVCAGFEIAGYLLSKKFDVINVYEIDPHMSDSDILKLAVSENRIIITIDKDFGDLVFTKGFPHNGVIRLEDDIPINKVLQMKLLIEKYSPLLEKNFVVVKGGKVRIRDFND